MADPVAVSPLRGRSIVVTRPAAQADELVRPLEALGAEAVRFPTIEIAPVEDPAPLRKAAREISTYDWVVFTSVNGVGAFGRALREEGVSVPTRSNGGDRPRFCAIGPATGAALEAIGMAPKVIPDEFVAEAVVDALGRETDLGGKRILLPRAAIAREALPDGLAARGAEVHVVEAYRTVQADRGNAEALRRRMEAGEVDLISFTASSTVRNFHELMAGENPSGSGPGPVADSSAGSVPVAAIGPITAGTARELGYDVVVVAEEYTIPGLVEATVRWFAGRAP